MHGWTQNWIRMKKWDDVYHLPVRVDDGGWIFDDGGNFVAQFVVEWKDLIEKVIDCINGTYTLKGRTSKFIYKDGVIQAENGSKLILIRGWGNLTGGGAMNLPVEDAQNIQDTFAEFIISRLTAQT